MYVCTSLPCNISEENKFKIMYVDCFGQRYMRYGHQKSNGTHYLPSDLSLIGGEVSLIVDDSAGDSNGPPKT